MKNLRWYMVGFLMLSTMLCYLDRQALSIASVVILPEFHLDKLQYSWIVTAYTVAYGIGQPLVGRFIDKVNTRRGLAISVTAWSIASMMHALGGGFWSFSALRALLGVTEAGNFPGAAKAVSEWFPAKERAFATGVYNCGAGLGALIAPPLIAIWLIPHYGWKAAFIATGSLGFIWVIGWLFLYYSPEHHPRISKEELEYIHAGQDETLATCEVDKSVWREVLGRRDFWALGLGRMLSDPVWGFYLYFIALYLHDARHWDLAKIGMFAWMPFLASDFGSLAGGAYSSWLIKRGYPVITARKIAMCTCAAVMPASIPAALVGSQYLAIFFICIVAFGHQAWAASMLTLPADLFPKRLVACASGFTATVSTVGSMVFMPFIGWMVKYHGYTPMFFIVAFMHPLAAVVVVTLLKSRRPEDHAPTPTPTMAG